MTTKVEQIRFERLRRFGCVCCRMLGIYNDQVDMHHLVDKGNREASGGHQATIPLCPYHHRGVLPPTWTRAIAAALLGPSLACGKKPFIERFGTEREMLEKVDLYLKSMVIRLAPTDTKS